MIAQTLDVLLRGRTDDFKKKFKEAENTFTKFKTTVVSDGQTVYSRLSSSFGGIAGMAATYLGPLSAGAFLGWGVKLAAEAESAQVGFATMLGSAEKAKLLLSQISTFASKTPFESKEIRDSARSLLSFGVDASQVMNRIKTLGDVASGSQSDIKDLALIFGKTLAKGKFELEQGNQLAERGIPIYSTLAKQMGKTQPELMKMISAGKISASDVQTAFETMSNAGGIFENAMEKQSGTMSGLFSSLVDAVSLVATDFGDILAEMFNFKGGLSAVSDFTAVFREQLASWKPALFAVKDIVVGVFSGIWSVISTFLAALKPAFDPVINFLGNTFGSTMESFRDNALSMLYAVQFGVENFPRYWDLAIAEIALAIETWYEDTKNMFTAVLPTVLLGFGEATISFFANLGSNIASGMTEIWDYIASGGDNKIDFVWLPLSEGFTKAMEETKRAANREMSDVEKILLDDVNQKQNSLQNDMGAFINKKMDALKKTAEDSQVTLEGTAKGDEQQQGATASSAKNNKGLAAVTKGTAAAFSAINAAKQDPNFKELQKQVQLQKDANKKLDTLITNTKTGLVAAPL